MLGLFGSSPSIDQQLRSFYVPFFEARMGMNHLQALDHFGSLMKQVKEESKRERTDRLPPNFGDYMLKTVSTDQGVQVMFDKLHAEGVTDSDIAQWWNLNDLERRMMLKVDELFRLAQYIDAIERGVSKDDAAALVRKHYPIYGDPADTTVTSGADRPLPHELKDRVNRYLENHADNPEVVKNEAAAFATFNAFVRDQIRKGRLKA